MILSGSVESIKAAWQRGGTSQNNLIRILSHTRSFIHVAIIHIYNTGLASVLPLIWTFFHPSAPLRLAAFFAYFSKSSSPCVAEPDRRLSPLCFHLSLPFAAPASNELRTERDRNKRRRKREMTIRVYFIYLWHKSITSSPPPGPRPAGILVLACLMLIHNVAFVILRAPSSPAFSNCSNCSTQF